MPKTNKSPLEATLVKAGLSSEEAEIYLDLLEHGAETASQIATHTTVKRTYVYKLVEGLLEKGLVREVKDGRTTKFEPNSPDHLLGLVEAKKYELSSAERELEAALRSLKDKYSSVEAKPVITYFEGEPGIRKVFKDIYGPKESVVWGCVDLEESDKAVPGYIIKDLIPLRVKNKVFAKSFIANSEQGRIVHSKDGQSLRESVLLDKNEYPLPAEIDVYDDKIALLGFEKNQFVGVLIQNKALATSLKSIFKLAFDSLKRS